jgi:hypothetical protein
MINVAFYDVSGNVTSVKLLIFPQKNRVNFQHGAYSQTLLEGTFFIVKDLFDESLLSSQPHHSTGEENKYGGLHQRSSEPVWRSGRRA